MLGAIWGALRVNGKSRNSRLDRFGGFIAPSRITNSGLKREVGTYSFYYYFVRTQINDFGDVIFS